MIRALVEQTFDSQKKYFVLAGTSEDDKPVSGLITGSEFHEVDTGLTYQFDEAGSSWHVVGLTPADIQAEIDAWLDEHPEATTTVEDGAISYAKLNSSLQETVDDVGDLKSAVQEIGHEALAAYAVETAGPADIVTVTDGADGIPMKKVVASITPVQDLHGYDNPWPGGGGKNLFNPALFVDRTASGVTSEVQADGTIHLSGTPSGTARYNSSTANIVLPAGTYTITGSPKDVRMRNDSTIIDTDGVFTSDGTTALYITVTVVSGTAIDIYEKIQIEAGSTATSWEPYSNICPISGHDSVTVTRTGANIINDVTFESGYYNAEGTATASDAMVRSANYMPTYGGETHLLSNKVGGYINNRIRVHEYNASKQWLRQVYVSDPLTTIGETYTHIWATSSDAAYYRFSLPISENVHLYNNIQTLPVNLSTLTGGTVYGGTLTVNEDGTGTVVVDRGFITVTSESQLKTYATSADYGSYSELDISSPSVTGSNVLSCICNMAKSITYSDRAETYKEYARVYNDLSGGVFLRAPKDANITTKAGMASYFDGAQVVYMLGTPTSYTLTASQLTTLLGTNNVWADAGQVTIDYRADTALYIDKKLAELQALILENINS